MSMFRVPCLLFAAMSRGLVTLYTACSMLDLNCSGAAFSLHNKHLMGGYVSAQLDFVGDNLTILQHICFHKSGQTIGILLAVLSQFTQSAKQKKQTLAFE